MRLKQTLRYITSVCGLLALGTLSLLVLFHEPTRWTCVSALDAEIGYQSYQSRFPKGVHVEAVNCRLRQMQLGSPLAREWTDKNGRVIQATLVDLTDHEVTLRRVDGKEGAIQIEELGAADQRYLETQHRRIHDAQGSREHDLRWTIGTVAILGVLSVMLICVLRFSFVNVVVRDTVCLALVALVIVAAVAWYRGLFKEPAELSAFLFSRGSCHPFGFLDVEPSDASRAMAELLEMPVLVALAAGTLGGFASATIRVCIRLSAKILAMVRSVLGLVWPRLLLPKQFGRYRVIRELGRGAMGVVYLGEDRKLDRRVAIKVPSFTGSLQQIKLAQERFEREARAMANVAHPNLCPIYDVGESDGKPYFTMAFIEGETLHDLMMQTRFPRDQIVGLVRSLALALHAAHEVEITHRDLKPANIMINRRREPIIMDFGLASRERGDEIELTKVGEIMGTPGYMAPEQISGDDIGPGADIYALGVILYQLLTGHFPHQGSIQEILVKRMSGVCPTRPSLLAKVDPRLEATCLKALSFRAKDRFRSAKAFADALQA